MERNSPPPLRDLDKRLREAVPGYYTRKMKAGSAAAIVEDICTTAYDIYFATHKSASDQVVTAILKGIWDNIEKLKPIHPGFREWTKERAVDPGVTIPYHPAAVQFFKEQKSWPAAMEEAQKKLLAMNP